MGAILLIILVIFGLCIWLACKQTKKEEENAPKFREQANGKPFCPNCGCTELSANNRGYSMVTGTIGSKDVYITCLKCGHRWIAGQYRRFYD